MYKAYMGCYSHVTNRGIRGDLQYHCSRLNLLKNSSPSYYLVLDQGTSSTKAFLFDENLDIPFKDHIKHSLEYPADHQVQSDALEIARACKELIKKALNYTQRVGGNISSAGLAVQRSTFLFWDKQTKNPLTAAISWQDDRAQDIVADMANESDRIFNITGTPFSPHFGGAKFLHFTKNDPILKKSVLTQNTCFGPLSTFLTHYLTNTLVIDYSIACRTQLLDLNNLKWSNDLCKLFHFPNESLLPLCNNVQSFGKMTLDGMTVPLNVVIGDQQAALLGQGGWDSGSIALNFGTSGSVCVNTGKNPVIVPNLLSSVLTADQENMLFMLEGTINECNSLFYRLEKELYIDHKEMVWHERCMNESTNGIFIPGVTGIAAPYWKSGLGTVKIDLENAKNDEIIRAAMESIGFLVHDIIKQMDLKDALPDMLTASGGGARAPLLQFIADMLLITVGHISLKDRTAIGVLQLLYKKNTGHYLSVGAECDEIFVPRMKKVTRAKKLKHWQHALAQVGL